MNYKSGSQAVAGDYIIAMVRGGKDVVAGIIHDLNEETGKAQVQYPDGQHLISAEVDVSECVAASDVVRSVEWEAPESPSAG